MLYEDDAVRINATVSRTRGNNRVFTSRLKGK